MFYTRANWGRTRHSDKCAAASANNFTRSFLSSRAAFLGVIGQITRQRRNLGYRQVNVNRPGASPAPR